MATESQTSMRGRLDDALRHIAECDKYIADAAEEKAFFDTLSQEERSEQAEYIAGKERLVAHAKRERFKSMAQKAALEREIAATQDTIGVGSGS
ncbi:hypothetical protein [Comamonas aquatica]|uniref:hypothetical protein n=1 Tax=Comamonas aquatica TaxID=225991 RepID=UPI0024469D81|nr:hypothetical protein [Comamonas aquatica]MDH0494144.1 hypothetical protein [Comamonas aquatica]